MLVASVAAVLALALGWMIGRASTEGTDAVADDATGTTRVTSTTVERPLATLPIVGEEIDGAEFDEPAVEEPVRPATGPTTTEAVGPIVGRVDVDDRLAGVPVRLVGVELGGVLVEADLASGTFVDYRSARVTTDGSPLVVGPDWTIVSSNGRSRVVDADGVATGADLGDGWQILHLPDSDLFWRVPRDGPSPDGLVLTLVGLDGEPVGPELALPFNTWPTLVDPASGGVVVGNAPRNYVVTPDGIEYLGTGTVIGIADDLLVTYDCDEAFVCSLQRTERSSGAVTIVPTDPELDVPYRWESLIGWGGSVGGTISPDGRWVSVIGTSWTSTVAGVVDLATGHFVELTRDSFPPTIVWSPDSRFAFTLQGQTPTAYDVSTGERFDVFTDFAQWAQLGARPLVPDTDVSGAAAEGPTLLSASPDEPVEG